MQIKEILKVERKILFPTYIPEMLHQVKVCYLYNTSAQVFIVSLTTMTSTSFQNPTGNSTNLQNPSLKSTQALFYKD